MYDFGLDFSDFLVSTMNVERKTATQDSSGGDVNTWSAVYTSIPCMVQPTNGFKQEQLAKMAVQVNYTIYTNQILVLQNGDRVISGGLKYLVQYTENQGGTGEVYAIYTKLTTG